MCVFWRVLNRETDAMEGGIQKTGVFCGENVRRQACFTVKHPHFASFICHVDFNFALKKIQLQAIVFLVQKKEGQRFSKSRKIHKLVGKVDLKCTRKKICGTKKNYVKYFILSFGFVGIYISRKQGHLHKKHDMTQIFFRGKCFCLKNVIKVCLESCDVITCAYFKVICNMTDLSGPLG